MAFSKASLEKEVQGGAYKAVPQAGLAPGVHPFCTSFADHQHPALARLPSPSLRVQVPQLEVLVVPVSGGGMISGIAVAAKALKPGIKARSAVIGWQLCGDMCVRGWVGCIPMVPYGVAGE